MIIPWQQLNGDTLEAILEDFILREGTDYGDQELSLTQKKQNLRTQLEQGIVVIVYSELHESVSIMPAQQFEQN